MAGDDKSKKNRKIIQSHIQNTHIHTYIYILIWENTYILINKMRPTSKHFRFLPIYCGKWTKSKQNTYVRITHRLKGEHFLANAKQQQRCVINTMIKCFSLFSIMIGSFWDEENTHPINSNTVGWHLSEEHRYKCVCMYWGSWMIFSFSL